MFYLKLLSILPLFFLVSGCAKQPDEVSHYINNVSQLDSPAANNALDAVSPGSYKRGYLQNSYDRWEKKEWEPAMTGEHRPRRPKHVEKTPTNVPAQMSEPPEKNDDNNFTLQHFYDKWNRYLEKKEKEGSQRPSNVERLDAMPAIGK